MANSPFGIPSSTSCFAAYPATIPPPRITILDWSIYPPLSPGVNAHRIENAHQTILSRLPRRQLRTQRPQEFCRVYDAFRAASESDFNFLTPAKPAVVDF